MKDRPEKAAPKISGSRRKKSSMGLLRNLSLHLQELREEDNRRIAREIHDEMAPTLTALKMDLFWIQHTLHESQDAAAVQARLGEMTELIDFLLKSMQRICAELRPVILEDLGLPAALEWQIDEFQKRTKIQCRADIDNHGIEIQSDLANAVFRIFQEALTNIYRHAGATKVSVSLKKNEKTDTLRLRVRDNGRGITPEEVAHPRAFGLIGMRERLYALDGRLRISGKDNKGTTLIAAIPLNRKKGKADAKAQHPARGRS